MLATRFLRIFRRSRRFRAPRVVVEFGTHSVKFHREIPGEVASVKVPYSLGYETYSTGRISRRTIRGIVKILKGTVHKEHRSSCFCFATSAVRDARNRAVFVGALRKLGFDVQILSGYEEASLLAEGYLTASSKLPALTADLGGGSLEIVYINQDRLVSRESLPLGVIRLHQLAVSDGPCWNEGLVNSWIEEQLGQTPLVRTGEVHVIGGTVKAVARTLRKTSLDRRDLTDLERRVREHGPPDDLKPERARLLLPGLLVLGKFLDHAGVETLTYLEGVSIGGVLLSGKSLSNCRRPSWRCFQKIVRTPHATVASRSKRVKTFNPNSSRKEKP